MTFDINPGDGCEIPASELLAMARIGLTDGPEASAEEFAEALSELPEATEAKR